MRHLKAFALGFVAAAALAYAVAATIAIAAQSAEGTHTAGVGPLILVSVTTDPNGSATTFGPGLVALAALGGLLNLLVAGVTRRDPGSRDDPVE